MAKLNGSVWAWIRTAVIVLSCVVAIVYGYGTTVGDLRVVRQRVANLERETDASRAEHRALSVDIRDQLRALDRQVARNSTKLDLLLRKDRQ